ncbi:MAG: polysaccharide deacetylase [Rhizobiaceae bacterium]
MFLSVPFRAFGVGAALLASISASLADPPHAKSQPVQYVLISFDSAHELSQWRRSRALAQRTGAKFTYFLSCVFLLSPETRKTYHPPSMKPGSSNIGFARSKEEVEQRLYQIRLASKEGHEMGSHGCGHFDGKGWGHADWASELGQFKTILAGAYTLNGLGPEPAGWRGITDSVHGFRAPYLSTNKAMFRALDTAGFTYDASGVSKGPMTPDLVDKPARFALPQIPEGPDERRVIAMDYNLFVRHSGGFERADKEGIFEERTLKAFREAFDAQYRGRRIPLQIGFHFSLMNGAAYWRALERFAEETCGKRQVACVTYSDYLRRVGKPPADAGG